MSTIKPKALTRASLAGPAPPDPDLPDPDPDLEVLEDDLDPDTVIFSFLEAFPDPTDDQVHRLAALLGYDDYGEFEEKIFELFGDEVQDGEIEDDDLDDDSEIDVEDDDDEVDDDPIGTFLISFFLVNSKPSEDQIHQLAELLGITPEEIEEKIYSMLTSLVEDEDSPAADEVDDDLVDELEGDEDLQE